MSNKKNVLTSSGIYSDSTLTENQKANIPSITDNNQASKPEQKSQAEIIITAADKIKHKALKTLSAKNNPYAQEFLEKPYHAIHDDLKQDIIVKIYENIDNINFDDTGSELLNDTQKKDLTFLGFTFNDYTETNEKMQSPTKRKIYQTVQNTMYQLHQKHYKREFITEYTVNDDGEPIENDIMVTKALQDYLNSTQNEYINDLIDDLRGILSGKQTIVLNYMLDGYKQNEIAEKMNIVESVVTDHKTGIRKKLYKLNERHDTPFNFSK